MLADTQRVKYVVSLATSGEGEGEGMILIRLEMVFELKPRTSRFMVMRHCAEVD